LFKVFVGRDIIYLLVSLQLKFRWNFCDQ